MVVIKFIAPSNDDTDVECNANIVIYKYERDRYKGALVWTVVSEAAGVDMDSCQ